VGSSMTLRTTMGDTAAYKRLPSRGRHSDIDRDNAVAGKQLSC
jgi:hypothetical protein